MPLFGTLDLDTALASAPTVDSFNPETWSLPGAQVLQVSYEVREDPALAVTPPALHPSIPPYATFSVLRCPESPVGAFNLAMVRLIVRAGIRPRGLLMAAFTDNDRAAEALTHGWGYRITTADVALSRRHNRTRGTVTIGGTLALDVSLNDPEPIAGSDLELFDNLHLTNVAGQDPVIVQVDPTYLYKSADRGAAELTIFDPAALGVQGIEPVYRLIAVVCDADIELAAPRFVMDPRLPAFQGTRRLQPR
jgi:Acetoacetate decarboxylase (ADC)